MDADVIIVGAGVVGLATAALSATLGLKTLLLEQHRSFGQETSSRNSEVVHSGIYYTPGSLKARLCVAGNGQTYARCDRFGIWYRRCGKLVVAVTREEEPQLDEICARGLQNGVDGLKRLTAKEVGLLEPRVRCVSALLVPSTGIVDSHGLMQAFLQEARSCGADAVFQVRVVSGAPEAAGFAIQCIDPDGSRITVSSRFVVNAAGLYADEVAGAFGIDCSEAGYILHPNRGHYFRVPPEKSRLVSHLVYPVPLPTMASLGIHVTLDRAGQVRLGPDAEYLDPAMDRDHWYHFDESRREAFYHAVARYFPDLSIDDLSPDLVGVRPKLQAPGEGPRDFIIREESDRGLPGLVNLVGIESPGLTCAGEIAKEVFRQLGILQ